MPDVIVVPSTTEQQKSSIFGEDAETTSSTSSRSFLGLDSNYSAQNSWFAYLPLEDILGKNYRSLDLHLTRFSLPQMVMGTTSVAYRGYNKEIPTKVINADTKELTLEYIVDEKWQNFRALYAWMSGIVGTLNPVTTDSTNSSISASDYINLRIYLLDNYKKKVIQFCFENCFIKMFNDIALDSNESGVVTHSFTFAYDNFTIEDL